jgi:hypothetical protein
LDGQGVTTIIDDDGLSSLTIADVGVDEGNFGSVTAAFAVTLSPTSTQVVQVEHTTLPGTATTGDDYVSTSGTLTSNPGDSTQTIAVPVNGDLTDEGDSETFIILLDNPSNANIADDTATGTIQDDESARFSIGFPITVQEGDSGTVSAVFTVTMSTPAAFTATIDYNTYSGIGDIFATLGVDYLEISGTLTFTARVTEQTFSITVLEDTDPKLDERFSARLTNPDPITIQTNSSSITILDNDKKIYLPLLMKN